MPFASLVDSFKSRVLAPALAARMNEAGAAWVTEAKSLAPEDTGYLKSTIGYTYDTSRLTLNLYCDASYAAFQEFGSSRSPAQPFMRPALGVVSRVFRGSAALQFANLAEKYQQKTVAHAASKAGGKHKIKAGRGKFA